MGNESSLIFIIIIKYFLVMNVLSFLFIFLLECNLVFGLER